MSSPRAVVLGAVLCLLVASSCRRKAVEPPAARLERLAEWERTYRAALPSEFESVTGAPLVDLTGPSDRSLGPAGPHLSLAPNALMVEGAMIASESEVALFGERLGAAWKADHLGEHAPSLEIDPATPWSVVSATAQALEDVGASGAVLVFAGVPPPPIPPSPLSEALERANAAQADPAEVLRPALGRCPAGTVVVDNARQTTPHQRGEFFVAAARELIENPACEVETSVLAAAAWAYAVNGRARVGNKVLLARLAKDGTSVALSAELPWAQAAPKLVAAVRGGKPVHLTTR